MLTPSLLTAHLLDLAALLVFATTLMASTIHDAATFRIPDRVLIPGTAAVLLALFLATMLSRNWLPLNRALGAAVASAGFYLALHGIGRGAFGFGDVKLALLIGLVTGWHSPRAAWLAPIVAFLAAGTGIMMLLVTRQIKRNTQIPFAPWMALGAVAALVAGR